ncbi:hypothetical protein TDSAC_0073 [Thermodesulfobium acidiphilum]|uniref:Uncharacterized protein n=1 Tax=Thermodesulfobium acidiphilum TaxID=1794699 RepID=A0A2R4VY42_THEAF|nr:hypothetical protein [Thermodesulfobium acidiphilum]AWB09463.1 hypothetical protein TDSAC_0073 [Thermodesulfobium acidiphilum]
MESTEKIDARLLTNILKGKFLLDDGALTAEKAENRISDGMDPNSAIG